MISPACPDRVSRSAGKGERPARRSLSWGPARTVSSGPDASFACTVDATAGSFRVPDYALANMPNGRVFEDGSLILLSLSELAPLNAPGVATGSVSLTSMDFRTTFFRD